MVYWGMVSRTTLTALNIGEAALTGTSLSIETFANVQIYKLFRVFFDILMKLEAMIEEEIEFDFFLYHSYEQKQLSSQSYY